MRPINEKRNAIVPREIFSWADIIRGGKNLQEIRLAESTTSTRETQDGGNGLSFYGREKELTAGGRRCEWYACLGGKRITTRQ